MAEDNKLDEAAIRADERFRMSVYTTSAAMTARSLPLQKNVSDLIYTLFMAHAEDILVSGARFSEVIEALPAENRAQFQKCRDGAEDALKSSVKTPPMWDARDLTEPGSFVQLAEDDEGNDSGNSGPLLN